MRGRAEAPSRLAADPAPICPLDRRTACWSRHRCFPLATQFAVVIKQRPDIAEQNFRLGHLMAGMTIAAVDRPDPTGSEDCRPRLFWAMASPAFRSASYLPSAGKTTLASCVASRRTEIAGAIVWVTSLHTRSISSCANNPLCADGSFCIEISFDHFRRHLAAIAADSNGGTAGNQRTCEQYEWNESGHGRRPR